MASVVDIVLSTTVVPARSGVGVNFATVIVPLSPASPPFSGVVTITGTDASKFQIYAPSGGAIFLQPAQALLSVGSYSINLVATQGGLSNSPFTKAFVLTAQDPLAHQNASPIPFPQLSTPIVDQDGNLETAWIRFFTNVWNQTNGSAFNFNVNFGVPDTPASQQAALYLDPNDGAFKVKFSNGTIRVLASP